ncbi:putative Ribosomal N-lysine methyltransferase 4 [Venustampulla echinocandica]|uniref:Putative Ribosomal N-lysine methyltransferase 4 n=1 Tax=Venustampulla echinocandica TaxID=2656787 RepID=A0A370TIE6_9HELO|nr:putative Ribosomal N-lysine methyltransferase 4 [Venustampulla echinocandica]RDL35117.1 putative Ribosomal N-lysine methyltransferase 4 [Venustampulla echinocandica]
METDGFQATTDAFISWLSDAGVRINPKIRIEDFRSDGRGRGVVAAADLAEDEVIFSIPRTSALNINNSLAGIDAGSSRDALLNMPSWLALTALIISESQQSNSKWAAYLAVLPRQLDTLTFWSELELTELQASTVVKKIGKAGAEAMFSQHLLPLGLGESSTDLFHRVASIIMAYAFDIPYEADSEQQTGTAGAEDDELVSDNGDEKTILSMIPLADMLNADADRNNARLCCDNEDLEMRTIKPISKGEEIFNDYGQLPRSDLLRRYGYVTDNYAPYDVAEISTSSIMSALTSGPLKLGEGQLLQPLSEMEAKRRLTLAEREDVHDDSYDLIHPNTEGPAIPDELLALIYLQLLDEESLRAIETSQSSLPSRSKLATELVGQVLAALIQLREKEYATSIEEDENLLQTESVPYRTKMAMQVRLGEKRVLRAAIQEASSFTGSNKRMRTGQGSEPQPPAQGSLPNGKRQAEDTLKAKKKGRYR